MTLVRWVVDAAYKEIRQTPVLLGELWIPQTTLFSRTRRVRPS